MSDQYIEKAEETILHTYDRYPVVFDRGEGVHLYDVDGKEYLDFAAGIAVQSLGYHNREYTQALKDQIDKLTHISNLYYTVPMMEAAQKVVKASGLSRVFFTNSGAEAIEGALKAAKKYAYERDGKADHEIIAMEHSFHGRSLGALSVTGNDHYREPFGPLLPGVRFARFNDLDSVRALVNDNTCGIIMETIQGEGGIYPASEEFLRGVRALCDEHDLVLILDEIQCGMGRSGSMFAWQEYGVKPDVMTVAKALGNGVPVGAFLACGKAADAMKPGDHGTTYGGNPFVCRAADTVLRLFEERHILEHVRIMGTYLWERLEEFAGNHECVVGHRGKGLIQGLEFDRPVGDIVSKALLDQRLVLISAGANVIRFVPPLVVTQDHVDLMLEKLEASL